MNTREISEANWNRDKELYGWALPPAAPWPFRLPVIRRFRAAWHAVGIERHERLITQCGFRIQIGYDRWVLYGIKRGWC